MHGRNLGAAEAQAAEVTANAERVLEREQYAATALRSDVAGEIERRRSAYEHRMQQRREHVEAELAAELAQAQPDWTYFELATGHDAMIMAPDALTDMLMRDTVIARQ